MLLVTDGYSKSPNFPNPTFKAKIALQNGNTNLHADL